jgi:8-oxo-dGTP pyrophosphatase MutT (NUDIX family)
LAPGKEDLAVCGNVDAGETDEQAAAREVLEETGIKEPMTLLENF